MEEFLKILKKILRSLVSPIIKLSWKRNLDSNYVQSSNRTCLLKAWTNESSSGESLNFVKSLQNIQRNVSSTNYEAKIARGSTDY